MTFIVIRKFFLFSFFIVGRNYSIPAILWRFLTWGICTVAPLKMRYLFEGERWSNTISIDTVIWTHLGPHSAL